MKPFYELNFTIIICLIAVATRRTSASTSARNAIQHNLQLLNEWSEIEIDFDMRQ